MLPRISELNPELGWIRVQARARGRTNILEITESPGTIDSLDAGKLAALLDPSTVKFDGRYISLSPSIEPELGIFPFVPPTPTRPNQNKAMLRQPRVNRVRSSITSSVIMQFKNAMGSDRLSSGSMQRLEEETAEGIVRDSSLRTSP